MHLHRLHLEIISKRSMSAESLKNYGDGNSLAQVLMRQTDGRNFGHGRVLKECLEKRKEKMRPKGFGSKEASLALAKGKLDQNRSSPLGFTFSPVATESRVELLFMFFSRLHFSKNFYGLLLHFSTGDVLPTCTGKNKRDHKQERGVRTHKELSLGNQSPASNNNVFCSIQNVNKILLIHCPNVTRTEPQVAMVINMKDFCSLVGFSPIPQRSATIVFSSLHPSI